jgi:hypothetical protein
VYIEIGEEFHSEEGACSERTLVREGEEHAFVRRAELGPAMEVSVCTHFVRR